MNILAKIFFWEKLASVPTRVGVAGAPPVLDIVVLDVVV